MKVVAAVVALGALCGVVGCGSGSSDDPLGPDPDIAAIEAHFQNPDGTFNEGNASRVVGGQTAASELNFSGTASAGSSSSTDDGDSSAGMQCDALRQGQESGTCACPDGGSFAYSVRTEKVNQVTDLYMKMKMNACSYRGSTIDGRQYMKMHIDQAAKDKGDMSMLFVIDASITKAGQTHALTLEQRMQNGIIEIALRVDDGFVSVRYESGKLVVKDRRGTWTCTNSTHGECTNEKGETQKF